MILAIEGLDGSGKSTVAREVSRLLGVPLVSGFASELGVPSGAFLERYEATSRYLYYLSATAFIHEQHAHSRGWVVVDRFIASAHALHSAAPVEASFCLEGLAFRDWGLTFFLNVDESERRARLRGRGRPLDPFEARLEEDDGFRSAVDWRMRRGPGTYVVETSHRSVDEIAHEISVRFREIVDSWASQ